MKHYPYPSPPTETDIIILDGKFEVHPTTTADNCQLYSVVNSETGRVRYENFTKGHAVDVANELNRKANLKDFTKILPYGPNAYTYWINGIYKIVKYESCTVYLAYFIQDYAKNWGDRVGGEPITCPFTKNTGFKTLEDATRQCTQHAKQYTPKPKTIKRAADIKTALIKKSAENSEN